MIEPKIEEKWKTVLWPEFQSEYFARLKSFLVDERKKYRVYPQGKHIFEAFNRTSFDRVKVVIIGQDPYHNPGQAHGLCFSVPHGVDVPPSLKNIYKELAADVGFVPPGHGNLEAWADRGVLLLNAVLTVRAHQAGSHRNKGWERFTDAAIKAVSQELPHVVFLLWGNYAKSKAGLIDASKHLILNSVHPSPLSASRGFFGNKHFSRANDFLIQKGLTPINWNLV